MQKYIEIFTNGYTSYFNYLKHDILNPSWGSYLYWLILVSIFFFALEVIIPWRKNQKIIRKDFWLDAFYMFFNFFIFWLIIYNAASDVIVNLFNDTIKSISGGFDMQKSNPLNSFPLWAILIIGFLVRDFVQWWVHRLLHSSEKLWQFHKVHHSVEEMGFAAHLRYHWMETIVYRSLEYIPLALLGIGLHDFFIIHIFTLAWGHYNHANIQVSGKVTGGIIGLLIGILIAHSLVDINLLSNPTTLTQIAAVFISALIGSLLLGPIMKYLFNSPEMHIWHHSYELPDDRKYGINFGITLGIWDYIFGTAHVPRKDGNIRLGFPEIESFPSSFVNQSLNGITNDHGK